MKKTLLFASMMAFAATQAQLTNVFSYGFDAAFPTTWTLTNQSQAASATTLWSKATYTTASTATNSIFGSGINAVPNGQAGGANSFALVNYTSGTGSVTLSNWLITPAILVKDGDIVSFYTRKGTDGTTDYPDRLELRMSTAATTVIPSTGPTDVGSFTTVGVTVNPSLLANFTYPKVWTQYSFTVSGVGSTAINARFAFRYFVTSGGTTGANSDIIGIDTFSIDRNNLSTAESSVSKNNVSVYPNPTSDVLFVKSPSTISNVTVTDFSGKVTRVNVVENEIDVRNLPAGMYIISGENKGGTFTEKFIKK